MAEEWFAISRRLLLRDAPLTILTPYTRERLGNSWLTRRLRMVVWDRGCGVRSVPVGFLLRDNQ